MNQPKPKEPIIEVSGISKSYTISHQHKAQYGSLRDNLMSFLDRPFLKKGQTESVEQDKEQFWALKDVSFTVNKGEIFGVVGKNGSGKSTLLKILSRIVEPTDGEVVMRGKVASLLEVGTGFHPELTGRENVFFNGSMLGMSRDEVGKKFDEIVKFAEIEKFLDTPVKFYSSGMYVRLAFAVAAHLDPEILILDEVLAVGDAAFQQKSLAKIMSTMEDNRTVLIVSHSIDTIRSICSRGVLLSDGHVASLGSIRKVLRDYTGIMPTLQPAQTQRLEGVKVLAAFGTDLEGMTPDSPLKLELKFATSKKLEDCYINVLVDDGKGNVVLHSRTDFVGDNPTFAKGVHTVNAEFPRCSLNPGSYSTWFRLYCKTDNIEYVADSDRITFEITGKRDALSTINIPSAWRWTDTPEKLPDGL
jgi:lipopolysaccharide transport system ATP-binding protein